MMRVLHVIPSLDLGGAERLLASLALEQNKDCESTIEIFTLLHGGRQMETLRSAGISVQEFVLAGGAWAKIRALIRLGNAIRTSDADVIHAWMYHSALLSFLFARNRRRVLFAIHHTNPADKGLPLATRVIARGCMLASWFAGPVVYVAQPSRVMHERAGFSPRMSCIVHVGVDETQMMPALPAARTKARQRLGLANEATVIIHVARYHRDKDQPTLLDAFGQAVKQVPRMHLLLVGQGLDATNSELRRLIELHGIAADVSLIGEQDSPLQALHAADIFCLSSRTEAFPVSLVEALQCGLIPVVTDVGECRAIAEGVGFVVPPNSAQHLADAFVKAATTAGPTPVSIRALGLRFGLTRMHDEYQNIYAGLIALTDSSQQPHLPL